MRPSAIALAFALTAGCAERTSGGEPPPETVVSVAVLSGRPQPAPVRASARVGATVVARIEGLGPARVVVLAPDGTRVTTTDAPLRRDGNVVGTEQRFVVSQAGAYQLAVAEAPEVVVGVVDAR